MQSLIKTKKGVATLLILVLVLAILALGAIAAYKFGFMNKQQETTPQAVNVPDQAGTQSTIEDRSGDITKLDAGDKISNIEQDLNKTDLNSIDKDASNAKTEAQGL